MSFIDFIPESVQWHLGWTLVHSLWQGALLWLAATAIQWMISKKNANARYLVHCAAVLLQLILFLSTLIFLTKPKDVSFFSFSNFSNTETFNQVSDTYSFSTDLVISFINTHINWLTVGWCIGVALFSIRFLGGLIFIQFLRNKCLKIADHWNEKLVQLSELAGIKTVIDLGESIHIHKPIVIGVVKPMILVPVGLLSSLPISHVEAILLHELSHIRRHDYLINLIQTLAEVIFFFNPFIWILSSRIRRERENCCDDHVIELGLNRLDYAKALANVHAFEFQSTPTLAMTFNKNKFQVLHRIKRVMENSINPEISKVKPFGLVILIVTGLLCAAWLVPDNLNVDGGAPEELTQLSSLQSSTDTVSTDLKKRETEKKEEKKSARFSRRTVTTYDSNGDPHEEVIEEYEGDEELRPLLLNPGSNSFAIPPIPSVPTIPAIPALPAIPTLPFAYSSEGDSIPGFFYFNDENWWNWEKFGEEMEKRFEQFDLESEDFAHRMDIWAEDFDHHFSFNFEGFDENLEDKLEMLQDRLNHLHESDEFNEKLGEGLREMEKHLERLDERLKAKEGEFHAFENKMKEYEQALQDQLIKDGYLQQGDEVESINWNGNKLSVNGIRIREEDLPKYETINRKYFKGSKGFYFKN